MILKIEYDVYLYKEIAQFSLNEMVQVTNRRGITRTIHITNITQLGWSDLQQLVSRGADKFSKMVLLYEHYSEFGFILGSESKGKPLSLSEKSEILKYIQIYQNNEFTKHFEVNDFISEKNRWDEFKSIRSMNNHGKYTEIKGIQPTYFKIICDILKISGEFGLPLDSYKEY